MVKNDSMYKNRRYFKLVSLYFSERAGKPVLFDWQTTEALNALGITRPILHLGLPDTFIDHGDPARLLALQGLDAAGITAAIQNRFAPA